MFNIFNSESLWIGTDMEMFNKIRTRLEQEGIPYKYKTKNPFSEKTEKGRKKSALPPKFCNKITALNVLSYAFLLTEDSGETY